MTSTVSTLFSSILRYPHSSLFLLTALLLTPMVAGCRQQPEEPRRTERSRIERRVLPIKGETELAIEGGVVARLDEPIPELWRGEERELQEHSVRLFTHARAHSESVPIRAFLSPNGWEIRIRPDVPLFPDEVYHGSVNLVLWLDEESETMLLSKGATQIELTTSGASSPRVKIVPARIHARPPREDVIEIVSLAGAVPRAKGRKAPKVLASVFGSAATTHSDPVPVRSNGSFSIRVPRPEGRLVNRYQRLPFNYFDFDDTVVITLLDHEEREIARVRLMFWAEEDGRTFVVRRRQAATIETVEGLLIDVPARLLETPWKIRLWESKPKKKLEELPPGLALAGSYRFELEQVVEEKSRPMFAKDRAVANHLERTVWVSVPAPDDALPGSLVVVVVPSYSPRWSHALVPMVIGRVTVRDGRRYLSTSADLQWAEDEQTCADILKEGRDPCLEADSLGEFRRTTDAVFLYERAERQVAKGAAELAEAEHWDRVARSRFQIFDSDSVKDRETGLEWASRDNGSDVDWAQAAVYCEGLNLAGESDWRLPSIHELSSIFWISHDEPCVRKTICHPPPGIDLTGIYAWSETRKDDSKVWMLSFTNASRFFVRPHLSNDSRALCVRGSRG